MFQLSELRSFVLRELAHSSTANDRVTDPVIDAALNAGYKDIALRTGCFRRNASLDTTADQARYSLPQDMFKVEAVSYSTYDTYLRQASIDSLTYLDADWRNDASGTPTRWYKFDERKVGLWVPPDTGDVSFWLEGRVGPWEVAVSTAAWSAQVVTLTTSEAHGLQTGEEIDVAGVDPSGYNSTTETVTVTDADTFTYGVASDPGAYVSGGYVYYYEGIRRLIERGVAPTTADMPALPGPYHMALVHYAVWMLAGGYLLDAAESEKRAAMGKERYEAMAAALAREQT